MGVPGNSDSRLNDVVGVTSNSNYGIMVRLNNVVVVPGNSDSRLNNVVGVTSNSNYGIMEYKTLSVSTGHNCYYERINHFNGL